jgi:hypothetical protein
MNKQTKEFQDRLRGDLRQAKAQLDELEARSKAEDKAVATDLIKRLKTQYQEIAKKTQELETSAQAEMDQEKADIETGIRKLKGDMAQLAAKLKTEPHKKVS